MTVPRRGTGLSCPARDRLARVLRGDVLRALVAGNILSSSIILVRGYGCCSRSNSTIYDQLVVAWAGHEPSDREIL